LLTDLTRVVVNSTGLPHVNTRAHYTVFGAGSVGTVLAACLASRGISTALMGRGAVESLRVEGDDETIDVRVPVVDHPEGIVLLCVHDSDVAEVCPSWPDRTVVTLSNGVTAEESAARWCNVIGGVWRMTCTLQLPGRALFTRRGRIVLGRWPSGEDAEVRAIAEDLRRAGFSTGVSPSISGDIWLKVLCNIGSTANALVPRADHTDPRFGAIKAALVEEAWRAMRSRGIVARSCDGRDASPDEEIRRQAKVGPRNRPVYNDTWRQLKLGRRPRERYHRIVTDLDATAILNARMALLLDSASTPECYSIEQLATALKWEHE